MKKIILFASFVSITLTGFGQSNKVVSAFRYHEHYQKSKDVEQLVLAVEYIDPAITHEKTMNETKTWYYRGMIYSSVHETKIENDKIKELKKIALKEAYKSYMKSLELDTRKEYASEVKGKLGTVLSQLINSGIDKYNAADYANSLESFELAIEVGDYFKRIDTAVIYNAALSAEKSNQLDKAVIHYQRLVSMKYGEGKTYSYLAAIYKTLKNDEKAFATIKEGRTAFPNDKGLIIEELNYYLAQGKLQEAINNINLAINSDPANHILHFALGTLYDNLANPEKGKPEPSEADFKSYIAKAESSYKKAIEIKPDYYDATFNLGALYFNDAVKINDKANDIKDDKLYKQERKKADDRFSLAIPYFEKALELQPGDKNTLLSLKQLYARTGQNDKYTKVKEQLEN